jgi:hypothetical protein
MKSLVSYLFSCYYLLGSETGFNTVSIPHTYIIEALEEFTLVPYTLFNWK